MNERVENKRIATNYPEVIIPHTSATLVLPPQHSNNNDNNNTSNTSSNHTQSYTKKCKYHRVRDHRLQPTSANNSKKEAIDTKKSDSNNGLCNNPDLFPNSQLIAERYLVFEAPEGSSFHNCIDVRTKLQLQCKILKKPCSALLTAHFRLDGHNHVNQLLKAINVNNSTYVFFSPTEGDLHSYVRIKKRLKENEAKNFFQQMCKVVLSCHEQGIILRDLKLRKFVFANAEKTHLKLETLEDAVILNDPANDLLQDKRGCPAYVSPEILRANAKYSGKAADVWALGVILYTMLVGRYPFNDSEHTNLFAKISRGHFVIPECLSAKARCMLRALLQRNSTERITSADILHHPWLREDKQKDFYSNCVTNDDQVVPQLDFIAKNQ